ncbi:MAG: transposase [Prevotella sp.]|nr:transposase [Prevotella sp.]
MPTHYYICAHLGFLHICHRLTRYRRNADRATFSSSTSVCSLSFLNFITFLRHQIAQKSDEVKKRSVIETINDELKNVAQLVHSRHRSVFNFVMNVLSVLAAYSFFEKKPSINIDYCIENVDGQLVVIK